MHKLTTHFLFLLTSIANNVKVVWKKRGTLPLRAVALETDIYEKAETFLRQQEGEKTYFSSPRAAMLFLIERANENIKTSSADEFVQLLLLNCARNFKPDSRIKFELLNECKRRVREIPCSGIPQVLQTLFTLFSPNAPELVEAFALYLDRITTEITIYNRGRAIPAEGYTSPVLTFLEDVNLLGNILATLDRCNLNRADLAVQVVEMFERHNYKQLEKANFQGLIDVLHYLAFSLDQHDAIDVVAIVIQQRLEEGVDASAGQLAAISECFIAAPLALNPLRHQALIHAIRHRANESKGNKKVLEDILDKLS
ncbi:hypothetical protein X943_003152 [Babesia divergens]|uniref:Uncharacterized protein n=1 Tax=Babesia divergens TaxID=32595 RepID=A0AAD9GDF2_BABDI|nr:hypothetical protein X943_003152 [Babesia divergens]